MSRWRSLQIAADVDRLTFPPPPSAFAAFGQRSVIAPPARVLLPECISIGDDVVIHEHVWFSVVHAFDAPPVVRIGNRVRIGRACQISVVGELVIEDDVLISDTVHIGDTYHRYDMLGVALHDQPMAEPRPVRIERGALVNYHAIVLQGVTVGANAYVHAGSVVTGDVPPGAVVIGNPARIVERGSAPWV
jgi:carbonic anhydrase/acetyltransferase-like protein (isoleucine patch superfamily)